MLSTTNARRWLAGVYVALALLVTWQRGIENRDHTTFAIFRQSFVHLAEHRDVYARYPDEQGAEVRDRFKYSPTAAVLFAPLAVLPYAAALLLWCLLNVGLLFYGVARLLPRREANIALLCLAPEVLASLQSASSNGIIAGLMLLALGWLFAHRDGRAAVALGIGAALKIFPLALALTVIPRGRVLRFGAIMAGVGLLLLILPLAVVSPHHLWQQYLSWRALGIDDARDVEFGLSLIRAVRTAWPSITPNWVFQIGGALLVMVPLLRRDRWDDPSFRLRLGCSVMLFAVLFNHQAERASLIIAAAGAAVWLVSRPRSALLYGVFAVALSGVSVVPYLVLWLSLQYELIAHGVTTATAPSTEVFAGRWNSIRTLRPAPDLAA